MPGQDDSSRPVYDQGTLARRCANCGTVQQPLVTVVMDWRTDMLCQSCTDSYDWPPAIWERERRSTLVTYRHK